jgi:hypothetical protein
VGLRILILLLFQAAQAVAGHLELKMVPMELLVKDLQVEPA